MSKYDELCQAFGHYAKQILLYKEQCYFLAQLLVEGMRESLGCQPAQLICVNQQKNRVHLENALYQEGDDPVYRLNLRLNLAHIVSFTTPDGEAEHSLSGWFSFCVLLSKQNSQFVLQVEGEKQIFTLDEALLKQAKGQQDSQLQAFYAFVFEQIRNEYRNGFQGFLNRKPSSFGFAIVDH